MADPATRQDAVEANIAACEATYGPDNIMKLIAVCIQDISISLAMLVDNSGQ